MANLLYGVSAADPVVFCASAALLFAMALVATWLPARRASRIDLVTTLRAE
jgi:ABC-type lipoprotein release transport system permease subunit